MTNCLASKFHISSRPRCSAFSALRMMIEPRDGEIQQVVGLLLNDVKKLKLLELVYSTNSSACSLPEVLLPDTLAWEIQDNGTEGIQHPQLGSTVPVLLRILRSGDFDQRIPIFDTTQRIIQLQTQLMHFLAKLNEKDVKNFEESQFSMSSYCRTSTLRTDGRLDGIYTCVLSLAPSLLDMGEKFSIRSPFSSSEEEWMSITLTVLGTLLYDSGLSFHLRCLEVHSPSIMRKTLELYQAAHDILQSVFLPLATKEQQYNINHGMKPFSSISQFQIGNHAGMVLLAVLNNLCAVNIELARTEQVTMLREEMKLIFLLVDPQIAFGHDEEARGFFLLNALFYGDNKDLRVARAA